MEEFESLEVDDQFFVEYFDKNKKAMILPLSQDKFIDDSKEYSEAEKVKATKGYILACAGVWDVEDPNEDLLLINGKICIVDPEHVEFVDMPEEIAKENSANYSEVDFADSDEEELKQFNARVELSNLICITGQEVTWEDLFCWNDLSEEVWKKTEEFRSGATFNSSP